MIARFFSTTIGQITAIVATASAVTFGLAILLFALIFPHAPPAPPWPWQVAYRVEALVESLQRAPPADAAAILTTLEGSITQSRMLEAPHVCDEFSDETRELELVLSEGLPPGAGPVMVRNCSDAPPQTGMQILIRMGERTLALRTPHVERRGTHLTFPMVGALLFLCVAVTAMSIWAVWRVIRPLRRLSEQADAFGRDREVAPITEEGPLEIQRAAAAVNRMQARVTRAMQDRTRMLAAVSHDLRTPLTRMQLALQTAEASPVHGRLLRDLGHMQVMVNSALAYLSHGNELETREPLDIAALLQTLCDEYADEGNAVTYDGAREAVAICRPNAIQRALGNLLDNAVQYGTHVQVSAQNDGRVIRITVANDGHAIPEDRLADIFEPFVRLDHARNDRPGSVGLGLSIVRDIIAGHHGVLEVENRSEGGVAMHVELPVAPPA